MQKLITSIFIVLSLATSCKKDPVKVLAPTSTVNYSITDTMHLSAITIDNFPDLNNNYNNKTYSRETNKIKSNYKVEGTDIILIFEDTSASNLGAELILKIPNKTLLTISGYYTAQTHEIFYKWLQRTSSSSAVFSIGYKKADSCNIQVNYDDKTKTLSGSITNLKYPFGIYVPFYLPGSAVKPRPSDEVFLTSGGSFRQHTVSFQFVKSS